MVAVKGEGGVNLHASNHIPGFLSSLIGLIEALHSQRAIVMIMI